MFNSVGTERSNKLFAVNEACTHFYQLWNKCSLVVVQIISHHTFFLPVFSFSTHTFLFFLELCRGHSFPWDISWHVITWVCNFTLCTEGNAHWPQQTLYIFFNRRIQLLESVTPSKQACKSVTAIPSLANIGRLHGIESRERNKHEAGWRPDFTA